MTRLQVYLRRRRDDILLFGASLIIAVAVYLQLELPSGSNKEREFDVPLTFSKLDRGLTVVQAPRSIRVVATSSRAGLDDLNTLSVRAVVDLESATTGPGRYRVIVTGPQSRNVEYSPIRSLVEVLVERSVETEFAVQVSTIGAPMEGIVYSGAIVTPERVTTQGPASSIERIKAVRSVLDLAEVVPGRERNLELEAIDSEGRPVTLVNFEPKVVSVIPIVTLKETERRLLVSPVFRGQPPIGYKVSSYTVTPNQVEVTGGSQDVSRVTIVDTEPIDLSSLKGTTNVRAKLKLPSGLDPIGPEYVMVNIVVGRA